MKRRSTAIVALVLVLGVAFVWLLMRADGGGGPRSVALPNAGDSDQPLAGTKPLVAPALAEEPTETRASAAPAPATEPAAATVPVERVNAVGSFQVVLCHGNDCGLEWDLPDFALEVREVQMNSGEPLPKLVSSANGMLPRPTFKSFAKSSGGYMTAAWEVMHVGGDGVLWLPHGTYELRPAPQAMLEFYMLRTWFVNVPVADVVRIPAMVKSRVKGVVFDLDGTPISEGVIQIESSSPELKFTTSQGINLNADGTFEHLVYPGTVNLDATAEGMSGHREVEIAPRQSAWIEVQLQPAPVDEPVLGTLEVRLVGAPPGLELRLDWVEDLVVEPVLLQSLMRSPNGRLVSQGAESSLARWVAVDGEATEFSGLSRATYSITVRTMESEHPGPQHELGRATVEHDGVTRVDLRYNVIQGPRVQGQVVSEFGRSAAFLAGLYPMDRPGIGPPLVISNELFPFDLVPPSPGEYLLGVQVDKGCVWHTQPIRIDGGNVLQVDVQLPSAWIEILPTGGRMQRRPAQLTLRRLDFSVPAASYRRSRCIDGRYRFNFLPDGRYVVDFPTGVEGATKPSSEIVVQNGEGATISVNEIAAP